MLTCLLLSVVVVHQPCPVHTMEDDADRWNQQEGFGGSYSYPPYQYDQQGSQFRLDQAGQGSMAPHDYRTNDQQHPQDPRAFNTDLSQPHYHRDYQPQQYDQQPQIIPYHQDHDLAEQYRAQHLQTNTSPRPLIDPSYTATLPPITTLSHSQSLDSYLTPSTSTMQYHAMQSQSSPQLTRMERAHSSRTSESTFDQYSYSTQSSVEMRGCTASPSSSQACSPNYVQIAHGQPQSSSNQLEATVLELRSRELKRKKRDQKPVQDKNDPKYRDKRKRNKEAVDRTRAKQIVEKKVNEKSFDYMKHRVKDQQQLLLELSQLIPGVQNYVENSDRQALLRPVTPELDEYLANCLRQEEEEEPRSKRARKSDRKKPSK